MKNLAFAAICMGSLGLLACGGGDSDIDGGITTGADASTSGADAAPPACNPVSNTGCPSDQKCTYIVESQDPFLGRTTCAPAGAVPLDGTCTRAEDGNDDCAGGLWCLGGLCSEICSSAPDSCGAESTCVSFVDLFDDVDNAGLCQPACHPNTAATDCPAGEGCFINLTSGKGSCANGFTDYPEASTGDASCAGAPGGQGCNCVYLNGCQAGYGCALNNEPENATGLECAYFCDVMGGGGPTCAQGPGPSFSCRQIMTFYNNSEMVPDDIGFCVNPDEWPCAGCVNENAAEGCGLAPPSDCDCLMAGDPNCDV